VSQLPKYKIGWGGGRMEGLGLWVVSVFVCVPWSVRLQFLPSTLLHMCLQYPIGVVSMMFVCLFVCCCWGFSQVLLAMKQYDEVVAITTQLIHNKFSSTKLLQLRARAFYYLVRPSGDQRLSLWTTLLCLPLADMCSQCSCAPCSPLGRSCAVPFAPAPCHGSARVGERVADVLHCVSLTLCCTVSRPAGRVTWTRPRRTC
jgi:hypothetical protein